MVKKSIFIESTRDLESPHNSHFAAFVLAIARQRIRADSAAVHVLVDAADRDVRGYLSSWCSRMNDAEGALPGDEHPTQEWTMPADILVLREPRLE